MKKTTQAIALELISDTMWPNGVIGKKALLMAIGKHEQKSAAVNDAATVEFIVVRVPFLLEPRYTQYPSDFKETHNDRMVRKFGSIDAFERFRDSHGLIPRYLVHSRLVT